MIISFRLLSSFSPGEKKSGIGALNYIIDDNLVITTLTNDDNHKLEIALGKSDTNIKPYDRSVILSDGKSNSYIHKRYLTDGLYNFFKYIKTSNVEETVFKLSQHSEFIHFLHYVLSRYREEEFVADITCMDEGDIYIANAVLISDILDRANKTIAITVPPKQ